MHLADLVNEVLDSKEIGDEYERIRRRALGITGDPEDDNLCWILLEYVHRLQGSRLQTLVQLPPGDDFDELERRLSVIGHRTVIFRDEDSGNAKNVKLAWNVTCLKKKT